jgi:hypothetical protein
VSMVPETITTTPPPSTIYVSPSGAPTGQVAQDNNVSSSGSHIGPIVGGVLAGFFGLLGIVLIVWFIMYALRFLHCSATANLLTSGNEGDDGMISSIKKTRHIPLTEDGQLSDFLWTPRWSLNLISMVLLGRPDPPLLASLRRALPPRPARPSTCLNTTSPPSVFPPLLPLRDPAPRRSLHGRPLLAPCGHSATHPGPRP